MERKTRTPAVLIVSLLIAACAKAPETEPRQEDIEAARAAAQRLGAALKSRLVEAISSQGPIAALEACSLEAPGIAAHVSEVAGYEVSRTALRVRNPMNAPDAWERMQLERLISAAEGGADPRSLESSAIVVENDAAVFRWMKPIVMEGPCIICHGEHVAPDVRAKIDELYPQDAATGFREGEIRGAFSVTRRISG